MNVSCDHSSEDSLNWLAFQYLAGELSVDEHQSFEDRLSRDVRACEAVARMMKTVDALAVAAPVAGSRPAGSAAACRPGVRRWLVWAGGAAAACVVAGLVWQGGSLSTDRRDRGDDRAVEILSAWADAAPDVSESSERLGPLDDDAALDVPGWMLRAVARSDEEADPEMEEN